MWDIVTWYMALGAVSLIVVGVWASKKKVAPAFLDDWLNPWTVVFAVIFWPLFLVNELFFNVPKQRRIRFEAVNAERRQARARRERESGERREFESVIGEEGVALTDLRLGGFVEVERRRWMAVSDGGFIEAGSRIVVDQRSGEELRVRPLPEPTNKAEQAVSSDGDEPSI